MSRSVARLNGLLTIALTTVVLLSLVILRILLLLHRYVVDVLHQVLVLHHSQVRRMQVLKHQELVVKLALEIRLQFLYEADHLVWGEADMLSVVGAHIEHLGKRLVVHLAHR